MRQLITLGFLLIICLWARLAYGQCGSGCTYVINNSNTWNWYNLSAGQKVCIPAGQVFYGSLAGTGTVEICGTYSGSAYVPPGINMVVRPNGKIVLSNVLQVEGSLINNGNARPAIELIGLSGAGNLTNNGEMSLGSSGLNKSGGTIINSNNISTAGPWVTSTSATVTNNGSLIFSGGSLTHHHTGANFTNNGSLVLTGAQSSLTMGGTGWFNNTGSIKGTAAGNNFTLETTGANTGTISFSGHLLVNTTHTLNNNYPGEFSGAGTLTINGRVDNASGASMSAAAMTIVGTLVNDGQFSLMGDCTSSGRITNNAQMHLGGKLANIGGLLTVNESLSVQGDLENNGASIVFAPNEVIRAYSFSTNPGGQLSCPSCGGAPRSCAGVSTVTAIHPAIAVGPIFTCQQNSPGCPCDAVRNGGLVALPVSLVNLRHQWVNERLLLTWATASETSNRGFYIEVSTDGTRYEAVGFMEGQGNSQRLVHYNYLLPDPVNHKGPLLVRLKQEDFDGNYAYSPVLSIQPGGAGDGRLLQVVNPSRAAEPLRLSWSIATRELGFNLTDALGRTAATGHGPAQQLEQQINQLMLMAGPGVYLLQLQAGVHEESHRLVRQ